MGNGHKILSLSFLLGECCYTSSNNIWTPSETQVFDGIPESFRILERSSPVYLISSYFTLFLCSIWKIVVVFFFLLFEMIEVVIEYCRIPLSLASNRRRTSSKLKGYLFLLLSFEKSGVDNFSFF
jgi:hypothetical protein